jgi:hypothetical protein
MQDALTAIERCQKPVIASAAPRHNMRHPVLL